VEFCLNKTRPDKVWHGLDNVQWDRTMSDRSFWLECFE
jgi:hypothetical protein